jgi:hypothetical protein
MPCFNLKLKLGTGDHLPSEDHILRYVRKKFVDINSGKITGNAFVPRVEEAEDGPSVNWMEYFDGDTNFQIEEIRKLRRIKYEKRGRVVSLNIGKVHEYIKESAQLLITSIYDPLPQANINGTIKPADPSHAFLKGIPLEDSPEAEAIGDLLVHCILENRSVEPD